MITELEDTNLLPDIMLVEGIKDNIQVALIGVTHTMKNVPATLYPILNEADILFQEGEGGVVGCPEPLSHSLHTDIDWYNRLLPAEQQMAHDIFERYQANISSIGMSDVDVASLPYWGIVSILCNTDVWHGGIHTKIDRMFKTSGKEVVDLDKVSVIPSYSFDLDGLKQELHEVDSLLKQPINDVLNHQEVKISFIDFLKFCSEEDAFWRTQNLEVKQEHFEREVKWLNLISDHISSKVDNTRVVIVCGITHLPGMVDKLSEKGFAMRSADLFDAKSVADLGQNAKKYKIDGVGDFRATSPVHKLELKGR